MLKRKLAADWLLLQPLVSSVGGDGACTVNKLSLQHVVVVVDCEDRG